MVLKVNGVIQIQYKAIELGSDHFLDFQGRGGGGGSRAGFSLTFRARIFFSICYEPEFFSQAIVGQNILFYANTNLEATL